MITYSGAVKKLLFLFFLFFKVGRLLKLLSVLYIYYTLKNITEKAIFLTI